MVWKALASLGFLALAGTAAQAQEPQYWPLECPANTSLKITAGKAACQGRTDPTLRTFACGKGRTFLLAPMLKGTQTRGACRYEVEDGTKQGWKYKQAFCPMPGAELKKKSPSEGYRCRNPADFSAGMNQDGEVTVQPNYSWGPFSCGAGYLKNQGASKKNQTCRKSVEVPNVVVRYDPPRLQ